ncbi:hypothetical protein [Clostridium tyrobutyricum]|uniref:hypothetical protein n=1 Tax=Clostridium tyrobutyricum TaxID=1519 RepID=UPI002011CB8B|nr:hypothetical protein [Clostridium tyrobutyricum]MBR9649460.1 hypothetical protein [Clostridium tyrobutyricum]
MELMKEESNNYENVIKNTFRKEYPIYLLEVFLKNLDNEGLVYNDKRKNKNDCLLDISTFSKEKNKLEYLFKNMNGIVKKCEEFEYRRGYRYFYIFRIGDYDNNIIKSLINNKKVVVFTDDLISNDFMDTIIRKPTYKTDNGKIIFKFNLELKSKLDEENSIKHTILAIINPKLKIIEIRQDVVPIMYQTSDDFYIGKVLDIKTWILTNLCCSIDNIDFQAVAKYMKSDKKDDVIITAVSIKRDGMKAVLDSASNIDLTLPILDELRNKIDSDEIFNLDDKNVKNIRQSLINFIEEIEENSDLPAAKILWKEKGYKISSYHDEVGGKSCSFKWIGELKDEESMNYVTEYLIECEKELRESFDN